MSLALKISKFNRERKWRIFLNYFKPEKKNKILDIGFTENEYSETDNFLEKHYPYLDKITALGIETPNSFSKKYPQVKAIKYQGEIFPFQDNEFDIAWSNAVLEHVGNKKQQIIFLKEIKRVSKVAFITTPNKYFPIEVHTRIPFLHWLPKKIFDFILTLLNKNWATGSFMNLLSLSDIKKILNQAEINNHKIIKNKLLFFTLDFVIMF